MAMERWAVHLTLQSSTKERVKQLAREDRRSVSSYLSRIVEDEIKTEAPSERTAG